ncbi:dTDP-4-dehydrorhamnose 3,5-epimerase family protein [Methanosarcina acetivorans]|uniref:dTDP-4-dehydrorhamnose 3,5-epimerase family protein n=1 Tax=Methanosarcina acetivorans TaxID=2214 RepID=UPI000B24FCFD|nr:dTDP-4-dehydrorhamnose 3,5-epimerase family protein [Methanosarcina acetivorans]
MIKKKSKIKDYRKDQRVRITKKDDSKKVEFFTYKCDEYYHSEAEAGIIYKDPTLNID